MRFRDPSSIPRSCRGSSETVSCAESTPLCAFCHLTKDSLRTDQTLITADAGYRSDANIEKLAEQETPALIADIGSRAWVEFATTMDESLPALYETAKAMNSQLALLIEARQMISDMNSAYGGEAPYNLCARIDASMRPNA
ncbi:hypothetical protein MASR1M60_26720 [Rhodocyclaceae bacterium]